MERQETTAVQLLAEWKRSASLSKSELDYRFADPENIKRSEEIKASHVAKADEVSRRLDEMAKNAGISYVSHGSYFRYKRIDFDYIGSGLNTERLATVANVPAEEQQAIQEWLLIKSKIK